MNELSTLAITGTDRIVNQDRTNHLHCRKQQILAYVAGREPWTELLMYCALDSTFDIYRHCYLKREYRWGYVTRYVNDADLRLLGFEAGHVGKVELTEFLDGFTDFLERDQPVFFYAPRADVPYWLDFMRRAGTVSSEYRQLHSFMVCGVSAGRDEVLIVDNTNEAHAYLPQRVPVAVLAAGYAREPERWFTGCSTLARTGEPDLPAFARRYRDFIEGLAEDAEIYDLLAQNFPAERAEFAETYRAPGVNSLALLVGSRAFFCRFLRLTSHSASVLRYYQQNTRLILRALERMSRYHAGGSDVSVDGLRHELALLRTRERQAIRLLKDDLVGRPTEFHLPATTATRRIGGRRGGDDAAPSFNDLVPVAAPAGSPA